MTTRHPEDKVCPVCERPFSWRKKWEKQWAEVVYCSKACRTGRYQRATRGSRGRHTQKKG
jgi:hypothetical protein